MRRRGGKWSDCVVGVVLLMLLGTFTLAQMLNVNETANRVKCASNLRQIGQAILLYSNDNRGAYPRTVAAPAASVQTATYGNGSACPDPFTGTPVGNQGAGGTGSRPTDHDGPATGFLLL